MVLVLAEPLFYMSYESVKSHKQLFFLVGVLWVLFFPTVGRCESIEKELDLTPEIIKSSPVLQKWWQRSPDVLEEIENQPSFRTRYRFGIPQFPSANQSLGIYLGLEDIFIGASPLALRVEYQRAIAQQHQSYGSDILYYLRPLGSYINFSPVLGFRHLETDSYSRDGLNIGGKLLLVLSRGGAADISLTQSWVSLGSAEEVGLTTLSFAYAITNNLRISAEIQKQNAKEDKDSKVGIILEWMR